MCMCGCVWGGDVLPFERLIVVQAQNDLRKIRHCFTVILAIKMPSIDIFGDVFSF